MVRGALQGVGGERGGGRDTFGSLAWAAGCREQGTQGSMADRGETGRSVSGILIWDHSKVVDMRQYVDGFMSTCHKLKSSERRETLIKKMPL